MTYNSVYSWAVNNNMEFNSEKFKFIRYSPSRRDPALSADTMILHYLQTSWWSMCNSWIVSNSQAHVLPSHAVKTRGGRSTFYHGHRKVHFSSSHISKPLFPGGMSVLQIRDITPFKHCQTYLVPVLLHDRHFVNKIEIYKCEPSP